MVKPTLASGSAVHQIPEIHAATIIGQVERPSADRFVGSLEPLPLTFTVHDSVTATNLRLLAVEDVAVGVVEDAAVVS